MNSNGWLDTLEGALAPVLAHLEADRAGRLVEKVDLTRLVDLLFRLPAESRERVLSGLPQPLARRARHGVSLPEVTVGAYADPTVIPYDADTTVATVRARDPDLRLPYLYVVDGEHPLAGVVHRRSRPCGVSPSGKYESVNGCG